MITLLARQVLGDRELGEASVGVEVLERGKVELEVLAAGYKIGLGLELSLIHISEPTRPY